MDVIKLAEQAGFKTANGSYHVNIVGTDANLDGLIALICAEKDAELMKHCAYNVTLTEELCRCEKRIAELEADLAKDRSALDRYCDEIDRLREGRDAQQARIEALREALEFECGNRCNAEYNPCNAREALAKDDAAAIGEQL